MRVLEKDTVQLFFGSIATLVFVAFMSQAHASIKTIKPISCQTAFGEKVFTIEGKSVAFHKENKAGRSISSVFEVRTQNTFKGFRKTLYKEGNKHLIHIENLDHLSDQEDYLAVTSPKGHKMTYPLTCKAL